MTRVAYIFLPALALAAALPAQAQDKAYCRELARDIADNHARAADAASVEAVGAITEEGQDGGDKSALLGDTRGAVLTGATSGDNWQIVYRRAYADCRAS